MSDSVASLLRIVGERMTSKPLLPSYITVPVKSAARPPRASQLRITRKS